MTTVPYVKPPKDALSSRIREELSQRILRGDFGPGERLVEMRLAEEMGTSQAPVREALKELATLGLVVSSKNRGTRVRTPSNTELKEIYDVRAELEGYAATIAVEKFSASVEPLRTLVNQMVEAAGKHDLQGFAEFNAAFHRTIVEAAGNATLLEIWTRLDVRSRTTVNIMRTGRDLEATARSHAPIVEAIASGDPALARVAVQRHVLAFKPTIEGEAGI